MIARPIAAPAYEPVTLAQAKLAARVDLTTEDALFTDILIPAVRQDCEQLLQRALMSQTWRLTLDAFDSGCIALPWPNLLSVESVQYRDIDGTWQTLSSALYEVDTASVPGVVRRALLATWPVTYPFRGSVRVNYTAGYATGTESAQQAAVPASVKRWILARIATAYVYREDIIAGMPVSALPNRFVDSALDRECVYGGC